jgi:sialate O-acetylesterase
MLPAEDAKPFLHPLFTDNMVLQRDLADPVWGWATPGQKVTVSVNGASALATAGPDGKWLARLEPMAAGGPYTLTVSGPQTVTLENVLVGDVWVCSGQSNMQFGLGEGLDGKAEIAAADHPNIRLLMVMGVVASSPRETFPVTANAGHWQVCSPDAARAFSAVGYFFGRDLYANQHVPIGLIESNWGGTVAEAWTSAAGLEAFPEFGPAIAALAATPDAGKNEADAWFAKNDPGSAGGLGWADPALDTSAWKTMTVPQFFQDAGDPEIANTNGVVWFRRTFDLPAGSAHKDAVLHLLADDSDATWVNGTLAGETDGWNIPRAYKIRAQLLKPTGNVIAVRVLDTGGKGGMQGEAASFDLKFADGPTLSLAGPWSYKPGTRLIPPMGVAGNPNVPTVLFNGMIAPLVPFGIKGALWYQGESNAERAKQYRTLLPSLIKDWRTHFDEGDFPFLIVQLAGYGPGGESWADLREAQMLTARNVPNVGIATAVDVGDEGNIHPPNKQEVGRRLALLAEGKVYGQPGEYIGPVYRSKQVEGSTIRLTFDHVGKGLVAKASQPLTAFELAGADGKFVPADAKIDGAEVVVSSPQVPEPVAVRYAWSSYPAVSLYNEAGLPAFPFRTDGPD